MVETCDGCKELTRKMGGFFNIKDRMTWPKFFCDFGEYRRPLAPAPFTPKCPPWCPKPAQKAAGDASS